MISKKPAAVWSVSNWLVLFGNGYGDSVIVRHSLGALAGRLNATLLCHEGSHRFLVNDLAFNKIVAVEMWWGEIGRDFDANSVLPMVAECDGFIAAVPWISAAVRQLRRDLKPRVSIGHFPEYDVYIPVDNTINNVELNFKFVKLFDPQADVLKCWLPPVFTPRVQDYVGELLCCLPTQAIPFAIHVDTMEAKMWSDQGWRFALDAFLDAHPHHVGLLVGYQQRDVFPALHHDRVIPLIGLSLEASMCVVSRSRFFVGVDSCMLHVADSFRRAGVGIFLRTRPEEFGFFNSPHKHLQFDGKPLESAVPELIAALEWAAQEP